MKTPQPMDDLRFWNTRHALTDVERQEIRRQRQREELGLGEPRVAISSAHIPPSVARQYVRMGSIRGGT